MYYIIYVISVPVLLGSLYLIRSELHTREAGSSHHNAD